MTPVEIARTYLGVKWVHQGRARHGLDCVGLLVMAFGDVGGRDRTDYGRDPVDGQLEAAIAEQFGPPIPMTQMQPGDVVCMAFPKIVRHVGIVTDHRDGLGLIHTNAHLGRVVEHALDAPWRKRIRFVHRWGRA